MPTSNYSISYNARLAAGTSVSANYAMVPNDSGVWVVATSANRTSYGRARGIARSAYSGTGTGAVDIQHDGVIPSAMAAGSASWVRVDANGALERCTPASSDDVIGHVNAYGDLNVLPLTQFATTVSLPLSLANGGTAQAGGVNAVAALAIDWTAGGVHTKALASGANTFTFSNAAAGMVIMVRLTSHAAGSTVTWPTVLWAGGAAPTQSTPSKTDVYTFVHDGTSIYGSVVQDMA